MTCHPLAETRKTPKPPRGGPAHRALKYVEEESETFYMTRMYQRTSRAYGAKTDSRHIFVGETRVATKRTLEGKANLAYEQTNTFWYHSDHLGSAQLVSTKDGHEYERVEYTPYGELWIEQRSEHMDQDGKTPFRFTGKELDAETGFYYYGARYLNPKTSIWISADPAVGDYIPKAPVDDEAKKHNENLPGMGGVFNYVNFHVYHYAGNNPIRYIDPDGREGKINLLKEFFDIFSIDIKIGIGLDLSIVSDLNFDLYSLQGTLSTDGLTDTITRGIGMWIIGVEQTAPKIEGMADMDSFSRFGKLEGNIGFFRFGEDGSDFVFSFGGQALVGFKFNISGNEIIDFIIKMGDTTHNE